MTPFLWRKKMEKKDLLQKKLTSIGRGVYWFGVFGRLSLIMGASILIWGFWVRLSGNSTGVDLAGSGVMHMFEGYLTLVARDAFEAIRELIIERGEIV